VEKPHGHNYRVRVTLSGAELDKPAAAGLQGTEGVLRPVMNYLDHEMINELEPFTSLNLRRRPGKYFYDETTRG